MHAPPTLLPRRILLSKKIHRLPVVDDNGTLVGVLSRGNIIKAALAARKAAPVANQLNTTQAEQSRDAQGKRFHAAGRAPALRGIVWMRGLRSRCDSWCRRCIGGGMCMETPAGCSRMGRGLRVVLCMLSMVFRSIR